MDIILEGHLQDGLGVAKYWISKIENVFFKKANMELELGTLNIKLDKDFVVKPSFIINAEEYGGNYNVLFQECTLFNCKAYILRSEKNICGNKDHNLNIIEIVSDINFRNNFNLENGDCVQVLIKM